MKIKKNEKRFKNDEEYFADTEFVTNSMLKDFLFCEYLYQVKHVDKTFISPRPGEPDYFVYGRAVDTILTERDGLFDKKFIQVATKIDPEILKELKDKRAEVKKEIKKKGDKPHKILDAQFKKIEEKISMIKNVSSKTQLTKGMYKDIMASVEELRRQPLYSMFNVKKRAQEIIALTIDGHKRKGKLDYIYPEKKIIADVKTTANIEKFDPRCYAKQLSYYRDLASEKYNIPRAEWDCYILAVDKVSLFKRSEIFHISDNLLNIAQAENKATLQLFAERIKTGFFNPVTKNEYDYLARRNKCFKCEHYPNCKFALQEDITLIS